MDPSLEQALMAYFQSEPVFAQTYQQLADKGGRSPAEWMYDHIQASPQDAVKFQAMTSGSAPAEGDGTTTTTVPLEQDLLGKTVDAGYADWADDARRKQEAADLMTKYQPAMDAAGHTIAGIYDGSLLKSEYGASETARQAQAQALAAQLAARRGALDTTIAGLTAAQDPVNAARLNDAITQGTAINIGQQQQHDQLMADFARDGYIGGSTGSDAAQERALIAARQGAAGVKGQALLANANDTAGIARYGATEGRTLSDFGSGETRGIADSAAQRNLGYFNNDITRQLQSLALPTAQVQTQLGIHSLADQYGRTGYKNFMSDLQAFKTNPTGAPTTQTYTASPTSQGSGEANLGAGLISVAGSLGNANNWWQTPNKTTAPKEVPLYS